MKDLLNIKGEVTLKRYLQNSLFSTIHCNNMIVNSGLTFFTQKILGLTEDTLHSIEIGSSNHPAAPGQTALTTQNASSQIRWIALGQSPGEMFIESYFGNTTGSFYVVEIGLFSENTMVARTVLSSENAFVKTAEETISVTWRIFLGGDIIT